MRSVIKRKCSIPSCDNHGTWRSGLCPTCTDKPDEIITANVNVTAGLVSRE
jgi:hypothetical protein